jgi:hypothetical protein
MDRDLICHTILALVRQRGPEKTICPSEVARALGGQDWRPWMDEVRSRGVELALAGDIVITQQGNILPLDHIKGPIRFRVTQQSMNKPLPDSR